MKGYKIHGWTKKDEQFLIDNFQEKSCSELALLIGCTIGGLKKKRKELKLYKTKEALSKIYSRPNAGQFAKGNEPLNTLHDKAVTERIDKNGNRYKWIRLSKANWQLLHVYLWLEAGNTIPENHIVVFKDKNSSNCTLENLELITRSENLRRNRKKYLSETDNRRQANAMLKQIEKEQKKKQRAALKEQRLLLKQRESKERHNIRFAEKGMSKNIKYVKVISEEKRRKIEAKKLRQQQALERRNSEAERVMRRKIESQPLFKTRKINYSGLSHVKVNSRTWIVVKPGTDIAPLISRYKEKSLL